VKELNIGETEIFEVWFIPTNRENYSDCILQQYFSLVSAQAYCDAIKTKMRGTMEIVRVRTVRALHEEVRNALDSADIKQRMGT
jgi:hypothetical protein